jgi:response regulator RpfG family c-di-GMP phosphodiesterase
MNVLVTPHFIKYLFKACPLHDIGKVGIPDAILKKADKLTPDEYEIIKKHPIMGKKIVDQSMIFYNQNSLLNMVHDVVYYHHERWDGTGYPCKLKGDEIPLSAQIMALCDVYDALVSKRRYKEPFSYEKADKIIIKGKNHHYNPILVDAFIEIRPSFHKISDRWKE